DRVSVLAELNVKNRVRNAKGRYGSHPRRVTHHRHGLTTKHKLPEINSNPFHSRQENMISAASINDQELAIIAEISGINDPAIVRRTDLRGGAGGDGEPFFDASEAIGRTEFVQFPADDRKRQFSLGLRKRNGGRNTN